MLSQRKTLAQVLAEPKQLKKQRNKYRLSENDE